MTRLIVEVSGRNWERRVELDIYDSSEMRKYPMCYVTHWADAPSPVVEKKVR